MKLLLLLLIPLWMLAAAPESAGAANEPVADEQPGQKQFYTPDEVSEAAIALKSELDDINATLVPSAETVEKEAALPAFIEALEDMRSKIDADNLSNLSVKELVKLIEQARVYEDELGEYEQVFQERVNAHTVTIAKLKSLESLWVKTLQNAVAENAPEAIVERINKTLVHIALMRDAAKRSYDKVLTFSDMGASEHQKLARLVKDAKAARVTLESRLFVRDSMPLLRALGTEDFEMLGFLRAAIETCNSIRQEYPLFYKENADRLMLHMLFSFVVLGVMLYLYVRERRGKLFLAYDEKIRGSLSFVRSPVASTVVLSILMVAAIYPDRPSVVGYINTLVALAALLVIIYRMSNRDLFSYALLLSILFMFGGLLNQIIGFETEIRFFWFVLTAILLLTLFNLYRPGGLISRIRPRKWLKIVIKLGPVAMGLLAVSLMANLLGYNQLAHKLSQSTLISLTIFMAFGVVSMLLGGLITMFVRRRSHASQRLMESYALQIEGNLKFIINGFLVAYWLYLVFRQFEISSFIAERLREMMALSWTIGDVTLSVGSMVDFVIVLVITSFLTRFVRIVLDLEVFSRYEFPRGVPTAIQMMLRYLIIGVGILLALSVLGIKMSDLSLLAGALGVGIGFGLRNIMANFVSGLLMIFERPVQLGDVVEVDKVFGDVQRIGVRATTIKTYDGSEVIVPNADFITKEVINWTLSSKLRRIKMAYKVAFGNDPKQVIGIIKRVIINHPDIKSDPEPKVLFEGYGDYYLEFTVYFWVEERLLDIKSETAIAIYEALTEAGVRMPVPQVRYEGNAPGN